MCERIEKIWVSPHYQLDTLNNITTAYLDGTPHEYEFDDSSLPFLIFEDRMNGWFFLPAHKLVEAGETVAAIHIVTPLIEALEERYQGKPSKKKSHCFFCRRAGIIFDLTDIDALDLLYGGIRCGFAHHGFLKDDEEKSNILISDTSMDSAVLYDSAEVPPILWVDARKYVQSIHDAYKDYHRQLGVDNDLKDKFREMWWRDWQMSSRVSGGCGSATRV